MKLVEIAHQFISKRVKNGSITLDLTSGNGKDAVFLAKQVGHQGRVYAFDIQESAISITKKALGETWLTFTSQTEKFMSQQIFKFNSQIALWKDFSSHA